jgi:DNA-binding IclR family transcriptional regulator
MGIMLTSGHELESDEGSADASNSVIGKVRLIIDAFGPDDDSLSLSELSRRTGISKASVHRLARELLDWGVLERNEFEYQLGIHLYEIGSRVPRIRVLRDNVRPFMADLHSATHETVHLAVLAGLEVLFVERANGYRQSPRQSRFAGRTHLHCSATGKVLMAFGSDELLDQVAHRAMPRMTRFTITSPRTLAGQVEQVRQDGFAIEREETALGYMSIAVPLFTGETTAVGALSITAPTYRADATRYLKALQAARQQMTAVGALI